MTFNTCLRGNRSSVDLADLFRHPWSKGAGLVKSGNGILVLSGNSGYTGPTLINSGDRRRRQFRLLSGASTVTMASGTVLSLSSVNAVNGFGQFVPVNGAGAAITSAEYRDFDG